MTIVIPFELLRIIFTDIPKKDLFECMNVCRLWYSAAAPKYFEQLVWKATRNQAFTEFIEKTLIDGSKAGNLVRKVGFLSDKDSVIIQQDEFEKVIDKLPKLEVIFVNYCYSNFISNIPNHKLPKVRQIMAGGSCIDRILTAQTRYALNKKLQHQITSMNLSTVCFKNKEWMQLSLGLSGFTVLKNLNLYCDQNRAARQEHTITGVLEACPSLTSLTISGYNRDNISTTIKTPHISLTSLELPPSFGLKEEHMEGIMQGIPNLKTLRCFVEKHFYEHIATVDMRTKDRLISYLQGIQHLEISTGVSGPFIPCFWDFWQDLCTQDCICDLEAAILPSYQSIYTTRFTKQNQNLRADCYIALCLTDDDYWSDQLNCLTFRSIRITEKDRGKYIQYDNYLTIYQPILQGLIRQQQDCAIYIENRSQLLYFDSVPFESRSKVERSRKRLGIFYGYIVGFNLEDDILDDLGRAFPHIRELTLEKCLPVEDESKRRSKICHIDLTQFTDVQKLKCDMDILFEQRNIDPKLYIQFINTRNETDYYFYNGEPQQRFCYLGKKEMRIPYGTSVVKIRHTQANEIVLTRNGKVVPLIA